MPAPVQGRARILSAFFSPRSPPACARSAEIARRARVIRWRAVFPLASFAETLRRFKVWRDTRRRVPLFWAPTARRPPLIRDCDRRSGGNGFEEIFGHELRHANAAMRRGITRKI